MNIRRQGRKEILSKAGIKKARGGAISRDKS